MWRYLLATLFCVVILSACGGGDKKQPALVPDVTAISFAETVSGVVPIRSGSGAYTADIVSGRDVVTAQIVSAGYTSGAVRLDPLKPGYAVVMVTDTVTGQTVSIAVNVKELVYLFKCAGVTIETQAVNADLDYIRAKAERLAAFGMNKQYVLSGRDGSISAITGADNRCEKIFGTEFVWYDTGDYDLVLTDNDLSRTLTVMPAPYNDFGFNLLRQYALMFTDEGTRAAPPPDPKGEVVFEENMMLYFSDTPGKFKVTAKYVISGGPDVTP